MLKALQVLLLFSVLSWICPAIGGEPALIGTLNGTEIRVTDLSLKEQLQLYKESRRTADRARRYFEEQVFNRLLEREASKEDLEREEYLRTRYFSKIPPITNEMVDRYIAENKHRYQQQMQDLPALESNIRRGLLEEKKDEILEKLKLDLFAREDIRFLFPVIPAPILDVPIGPNDARMGPDDAPVTVVAFMDLECPFCRKIYPKLLSVLKTYKDQTRVIFKHFPLGMHPNAFSLAVAAECAGTQGLFFDYVEGVYQPGKESACASCIRDLPQQMNMDTAAMSDCQKSNVMNPKIIEDIRIAKELGITSVPTLIVNGYPIVGNAETEEIIASVQEALSKNKSK